MSNLRTLLKAAFVLTTLFVWCAPVSAEDAPSDPPVLHTGQAEDGRLPFLFPMGAPRRGIYADIAARISDRAGIRIEWGVYPATRGRYLFERCKLQLEFGVSPSWYSDEERAHSKFSIPFISHTDILAYAGPDKGLDHVPVSEQPVLAVLGYRYPTFEFDERFDVDSERTMIRMLATGHAKLGILQKNRRPVSGKGHGCRNFLRPGGADDRPVVACSQLRCGAPSGPEHGHCRAEIQRRDRPDRCAVSGARAGQGQSLTTNTEHPARRTTRAAVDPRK